VRYCSWLFASAAVRAPLIGMYALLAQWSALTDPATEPSAARIKLAWWQDEIRRLLAGSPVHPISVYLMSLPGAAAVDFAPLTRAVDAAAAETNGAPLERGADLEPQACALRASPLALVSRLAAADVGQTPFDEAAFDEAALGRCTEALAVAEYLARGLRDYRREARLGRVPFPVDELLAAGIDNASLCAAQPAPQLEHYLQQLRERAAQCYETAAQALPAPLRAQQRHLLVLAALGLRHLRQRSATFESRGMRDMLLAWSTARRAHE
jgi:phytoene synthase